MHDKVNCNSPVMNERERGGNGGGSGKVDGVLDIVEGDQEYGNNRSWKREKSKVKLRFLAEGADKIGCAVGKERNGLIILVVC